MMVFNAMIGQMNLAPLLRPLGVPENALRVCLLVLAKDVDRINDFLAAHPGAKPELLVFPDLSQERARLTTAELPDGQPVPVGAMPEAAARPDLEKIFICPANPDECAAYLTEICRFFASYGVGQLFLFGAEAPSHTLRPAMPDFFAEHSTPLLEAAAALADSASKEVFAARLKALLAGNAAYLPVAGHPDYFHPLVQPESGDVMIDGGVSDLVGAQLSFSAAVGARGRIYGFEPIPRMWESARAKLSAYGNYQLECAGLAEAPGEAVFEDLRDSSHLAGAAGAQNGVQCALASIDSFCGENGVGRVDCIKLDVEGAELAALKGAREVIRRDRPKLIVCLYHNPRDMYEIPLYIKALEPGYQLYLSHTSCQFMDTVLYAKIS